MTAPIAAYIEIINKSNEPIIEPEYHAWPSTDKHDMTPEQWAYRKQVNKEVQVRYERWLKPKEKKSMIQRFFGLFKKK